MNMTKNMRDVVENIVAERSQVVKVKEKMKKNERNIYRKMDRDRERQSAVEFRRWVKT